MAAHFRRRKSFVVGMLIFAELFMKASFLPIFSNQLKTTPAVFWLLTVPWSTINFGLYFWILLARKRSLVIIAAVAQIILFSTTYWSVGWISAAIKRAYGYD